MKTRQPRILHVLTHDTFLWPWAIKKMWVIVVKNELRKFCSPLFCSSVPVLSSQSLKKLHKIYQSWAAVSHGLPGKNVCMFLLNVLFSWMYVTFTKRIKTVRNLCLVYFFQFCRWKSKTSFHKTMKLLIDFLVSCYSNAATFMPLCHLFTECPKCFLVCLPATKHLRLWYI